MDVDIEARKLARQLCKSFFARPVSPKECKVCDDATERIKSFLRDLEKYCVSRIKA